jgi:hypothetical protein
MRLSELPDLYLDNDLPTDLVNDLFVLGHVSIHSRTRNATRASDPAQLLTAAQQGWVLVTHNRHDFEMLHIAWRLWGQVYGSIPSHAGILILPQIPRYDYAAPLNDFLSTHTDPLTDELHVYDRRRGWWLWTPRPWS